MKDKKPKKPYGIAISKRLHTYLIVKKGTMQAKNPNENISMGSVAEGLIMGKKKK